MVEALHSRLAVAEVHHTVLEEAAGHSLAGPGVDRLDPVDTK